MGTGPDGTTYQIGEMAGTEQETLSVQQIPNHTHTMLASTSPAQATSPQGSVPGQSSLITLYSPETPSVNLAASSISPVGGSQPHENCQPFLCINFIISLFGRFPSQT
jgi:microcystin-dependent protein